MCSTACTIHGISVEYRCLSTGDHCLKITAQKLPANFGPALPTLLYPDCFICTLVLYDLVLGLMAGKCQEDSQKTAWICTLYHIIQYVHYLCAFQQLQSCCYKHKKHLKNVRPIRHCDPPHAAVVHCHSPGVAAVARRLRYSYSYRCPQQQWRRLQRQLVTEGTAMAP